MKRGMDLLISASLLVVMSPVLAIVAVLIRCFLGVPVLFRQERAGIRGIPFMLFKFRTMKDEFDSSGKPLPDKKRLTRLGILLRKSSLDEWPQLVNVIRGNMSLVGPRPLYVSYIEHYNKEQLRRLDVLPGITGWAQVNGRNVINWETKFTLDVWYVNHRSFALDLWILCLTFFRLFRFSDAHAPGHVSMPEFTANRKPSEPNQSHEQP